LKEGGEAKKGKKKEEKTEVGDTYLYMGERKKDPSIKQDEKGGKKKEGVRQPAGSVPPCRVEERKKKGGPLLRRPKKEEKEKKKGGNRLFRCLSCISEKGRRRDERKKVSFVGARTFRRGKEGDRSPDRRGGRRGGRREEKRRPASRRLIFCHRPSVGKREKRKIQFGEFLPQGARVEGPGKKRASADFLVLSRDRRKGEKSQNLLSRGEGGRKREKKEKTQSRRAVQPFP